MKKETDWDITVASEAPKAPSWKKRRKTKSSTMLVTVATSTKIMLERESPNPR